MRLSVLDQSPIRSGVSPSQAIQETLELAQLCDVLGYHRYWLAEHHATGGLAGSCPEILMGQVAALTQNLRIGSGGVSPRSSSEAPSASVLSLPASSAASPADIGSALGIRFHSFAAVGSNPSFKPDRSKARPSSLGSARLRRAGGSFTLAADFLVGPSC